MNYETALNQMTQSNNGFGRLKMMIGANTFTVGKDGDDFDSINFRFKGSRKANCVKLAYNHLSDTYNLKFFKIGRHTFTVVAEFTDVYADSLKEVFEETTKLHLSFAGV